MNKNLLRNVNALIMPLILIFPMAQAHLGLSNKINTSNERTATVWARGVSMEVHKSMYISPTNGKFDNPPDDVFGHVNEDGTIDGFYGLPAAKDALRCSETTGSNVCEPDHDVIQGTILFYPTGTVGRN